MPKSLLFILPILLIVLITLNLGLWYTTKNKPVAPPNNSPQPTLAPPTSVKPIGNLALTPQIRQEGKNYIIELWLEPNSPLPLSTLAVKATVTAPIGTITASNPNLTLGPNFKGGKWTIPFSGVESQANGSLTVKLAALYASPQPFDLSTRMLLASFEIKADKATSIQLTLDPSSSQLFDKQGNEFTFTGSGSPITLKVK
jgi:hypothetical protein